MEDAAALTSERIVVRAPNWLGDCVLSLAALRDLRRNFPQARIEALARPGVAPLFEAVAEVDAVRLSVSPRVDASLLRGAFDLALIFPNSFAAALAPWLAGVPRRWGYATDGRRALLTRSASVPQGVRGRSEVYYYRAMLAGLGLKTTSTPDVSLSPLPAWTAAAIDRLGHAGPWVGINPGAFFGTAKRWVPERYAAVADALVRRSGVRIVILGAAPERPLANAIASSMREPAHVLCGETSLGELVGAIARLRLLLTNDSGPMHVASAVGTPAVAIFGPTDWRETAPVGPGPFRLVREDVPCAPCKLRDCPIDHACMTRIDAERVSAAASELLS